MWGERKVDVVKRRGLMVVGEVIKGKRDEGGGKRKRRRD